MATIGHTLVGLSLASAGPAREQRRGFLRPAWWGVVVLAAHLPDMVEWICGIVTPGWEGRHFVTRSPLTAAGVFVGFCTLVGILTRAKQARVYVILLAAMTSHVVLDQPRVRFGLLWLLSGKFPKDIAMSSPPLVASAVAEIWLYGLVFLMIFHWTHARTPDSPKLGRRLGTYLSFACLVCGLLTAILARLVPHRDTLPPAMHLIWAVPYTVLALHLLLLHRRDIRLRLAWNLIPLLPVAALLVVEVYAGYLLNRGLDMQRQKNWPAAISLHRRVIALPTRSNKLRSHLYLSVGLEKESRYAEAQAVLQNARRLFPDEDWPTYFLARFYGDLRKVGTEYYQPQRALDLLRTVTSSHYDHRARQMEAQIRAGQTSYLPNRPSP